MNGSSIFDRKKKYKNNFVNNN